MATPASRLAIRWIDTAQAKRAIRTNQIRPSWQHFVPELGRAKTGICFDLMTHANWRADERTIGILLDTANLADPKSAHAIDGQKVFTLTERMRWENPIQQLESAKAAKASAHLYSERADELFVTETIDKLGDRISAFVVLDGGRKMDPKFEEALNAFCAANNVPVLRLKQAQFNDARWAEGGVAKLLAAHKAKLEIGLAKIPSAAKLKAA